MSMVGVMVDSWRDPVATMRRIARAGQREDRALAILMGASLVMFVARAPSLARAAALDPSVPLPARLEITLFVMLCLMPLAAYGLSTALYMALRAAGFHVRSHDVRLALFWSMLAVTPAMLLHGLAEGLWGQTLLVTGLGILVFMAFLRFLFCGLSATIESAK